MKKNFLIMGLLIIILAASLLAAACSTKGTGINAGKSSNNENSGNNAGSQDKGSFSVWLVYWDTENIPKGFETNKDKIDNVCYFSSYFDEAGKLFIPEGTTNAWKMVEETHGSKPYTSYLTFVNDAKKADGSSSLKDTDILYTKFSSEESMENHINEVLTLTLEGGFDGIEIDYEAINKDKKLWKLYLQFLDKLNQTASERGISLRVLLEPGAPIGELAFPQGPEYVMMCYNLYGYGTEPGPKADREFLLDMVQKMKSMPGRVNFALANGGFDFAEDGKTAQLTEEKAVELSRKYGVKLARDNESRSLVFNYKDSTGVSHEVWYADDETLDYWMSVIKEAGENSFSLWRL